MKKSFKFRTLLPFAILFLVLLFALPRIAKLSLDYRKGQPWKYETLFAPFDFPILKTDEQMLQEMGNTQAPFVPYYKFSTEVRDANLKKAENVDLGNFNVLKSSIISYMSDLYDAGIVSDEGIVSNGTSGSPEVIYIQRDKRAKAYPADDVYSVSEAKAELRGRVGESLKKYRWKATATAELDSIMTLAGIYDLLVPTLVYDKQTTELVMAESGGQVSPTAGYVRAGQLIVSKDEIVTAEIAQILDSYKKEYEVSMGYSGSEFLFWLGNGIIALALVVLLLLSIYFADCSVLGTSNKLAYLLLIVTAFMLVGILVPRFQSDLIYIIPFTLCAMLLEPFFGNKLILPCYAIALLPLAMFADNGIVLYVMFFVAGAVSLYTGRNLNRGWRQFVNALITFAVLVVVYMGFRCIDMISGNTLGAVILLFAASLLPIAGYPLIFLFERIFNLISPNRLAELGDTSNHLLQELEKKAPGTFQHSLQVSNMAEAAARAIGANVPLIRAGALYHDIGKMRNPLCFIENQTTLGIEDAEGYHAGLSPLQSAIDIIKHVSDGVEIAQKNHIPQPIIDFIISHHGTSRQNYFYSKYLKAGGTRDHASDFEYHGRKPRTREELILMLCDSIEAASRTLKEYTAQSFNDFVENMVDSKMSEGQFEDAEITVRELQTVKEVIKGYLSQIYHERIAYPKKVQK